MKLEQLQTNAAISGIVPDVLVTVVSVQWFGSEALELTYKTPTGKVANELIYRHDEPRLDLVKLGRPWSFDGDGALFRLVSEAQRIRLAHLFDPVLAVHTSVVDPLPHQITAVHEAMLPRQPLRFLLADDPVAGKTIMAGLLIKELIARGDLQRWVTSYCVSGSVPSKPSYSLLIASRKLYIWPTKSSLCRRGQGELSKQFRFHYHGPAQWT
jgi:hypothetical protein